MMARIKVLIVEDDAVIANIEKWRLLKLGYELCGSAENGADALSSVENLKPDIVLMDIGLKGDIDGIETAGRIKKDFNIPVIFVSSNMDDATISRAREIQPDGFIKKPFDDDDLRILIDISLIYHSGIKISKIAKYSESELIEKVESLTKDSVISDTHIKSLIVATLSFNGNAVNEILLRATINIGFEETFCSVVFPFLRRVGIMFTRHITHRLRVNRNRQS